VTSKARPAEVQIELIGGRGKKNDPEKRKGGSQTIESGKEKQTLKRGEQRRRWGKIRERYQAKHRDSYQGDKRKSLM